ncbi:Clavaminate synthase-like protein [Coccomyxa subellipsoidea C-169]|uniref:Clavaminate synthase-like protein n=1 Tax=Coccomyxa subellipsoidea (strain C-169) TaxID=574566 RepID=I0Z211_COCSC|nr:Clavaminate synthase-like protein [Coccomyxa subellipsoidea C-169]EIE24680.1 Clavaminate synthase-like protein [Coccomyxa subellipsoidea C-169]|eukprot:XP_005649224.1 Clavaminate synthase-like protein [Coccomyxa subellipsoidea C-169]
MLVPGMPLHEFAQRMQAGCTLLPLIYPGSEFYYLQSPLWPEILPDVDLNGPPFNCVTQPDPSDPEEGMAVRQVARMWLSPSGAVSPLHYDGHTSFLTQIRGRKRLLLYPPSALSKLQPYPSWHILRRRCRLDPAKPDLKRFPDFHQIEAVETVLEPGDTLFFPPRWAHYTESLDLSISLTYRFGPRRPATARLVNGLRQCKVSAKNMAGIRCGRIFVK